VRSLASCAQARFATGPPGALLRASSEFALGSRLFGAPSPSFGGRQRDQPYGRSPRPHQTGGGEALAGAFSGKVGTGFPFENATNARMPIFRFTHAGKNERVRGRAGEERAWSIMAPRVLAKTNPMAKTSMAMSLTPRAPTRPPRRRRVAR